MTPQEILNLKEKKVRQKEGLDWCYSFPFFVSVGSRSIDPVLVTVPVRVVVATVVRLSRAGRLGCSRCLGFVWLVGHKDIASVRWFDRRSSWLALLACLDLLL